MGFKDTNLESLEVPIAKTTDELRGYYKALGDSVYEIEASTEQMYRELDVLEQVGNGQTFVPVDGVTVRSPIRPDVEQMTRVELQDEIKKLEHRYRTSLEEHKGIAKALNGLISISEKMAV